MSSIRLKVELDQVNLFWVGLKLSHNQSYFALEFKFCINFDLSKLGSTRMRLSSSQLEFQALPRPALLLGCERLKSVE